MSVQLAISQHLIIIFHIIPYQNALAKMKLSLAAILILNQWNNVKIELLLLGLLNFHSPTCPNHELFY